MDKLAAFVKSIAEDRDYRVSPAVKAEAAELIKTLPEIDCRTTITVDGAAHAITGTFIGDQLRKRLGVPADRHLWLRNEKEGGDDSLVEDRKAICLYGGERFYTAPKEING